MPTSTASTPPTRFSRPRFALLVLFGVYPLLTALLYLVVPLTHDWTIWQRSLLVAPVMVVIIIWGVIPTIHKLFRDFINPTTALSTQPK